MTIPSPAHLQSLLARLSAEKIPASELAWLAPLIDHTLLKTDATKEQVAALCEEAITNGFGAVCVRLPFVPHCVEKLRGTKVKVAAVAGFPTGAESTPEKVSEARAAIEAGAREIDMVMQVGQLKEGNLKAALEDIQAVVQACGKIPVKVILETCLLNQEEKLMAAGLAKAAGAAFLKTSTGFSTGGATEEDVALLRRIARQEMGVKASGGVKSLETALRMVLAGANRIGTSSGVAILNSSPERSTGIY